MDGTVSNEVLMLEGGFLNSVGKRLGEGEAILISFSWTSIQKRKVPAISNFFALLYARLSKMSLAEYKSFTTTMIYYNVTQLCWGKKKW